MWNCLWLCFVVVHFVDAVVLCLVISYQYNLSTHPIDGTLSTPYQRILLTHPIHPPYQPTLPTHHIIAVICQCIPI